jgi:formylmethanofuran--tetrahydromethanopterin N-formyltransferase
MELNNPCEVKCLHSNKFINFNTPQPKRLDLGMALIQDTFAEAFDGLFVRFILTAIDGKRLVKAAYSSTALPSVVIGRAEGGVEKWLDKQYTPDHRIGAVIQLWGSWDSSRPETSLKRFYKEVCYRIRQGILVVPTTAVFNGYEAGGKFDMMDGVGHCGDGYETVENYGGREVIRIPIMMGDFVIERYIGYGLGVAGGNIWLFCRDVRSALRAGDKAVEAVKSVDGAVTTFGVCAAGSKPETKFPEIGPTTNHPYCPTLRGKIPDSRVPEEVNSIPEIVINGINLEAVKSAMKAAIMAVKNVPGLLQISAGNYGGKLGKYKIYLRELS